MVENPEQPSENKPVATKGKRGRRTFYPQPKELTLSQQFFVAEVIKELATDKPRKDFTGCAVRAGYPAHNSAGRLMHDPRIKKVIDYEMSKVHKRAEITAEQVLSDIKEIGDRCMQAEPVLDKHGAPTGEWRFDSQGALRSRELLGKHFECFTDKIKQSGEMNLKVIIQEEPTPKMEKKHEQ